jgi:enoyl-CoA hydratase
MSLTDYRTLKFDRRGRILTITLNLPDTLNAFAGSLHTEFSKVFIDAAEDPESDIIVLTGAGRAFSAGGDLDLIESLRGNAPEFHRSIREAKRLVFSMLDCEKPVIAKVNGDAIGLGTTVMLFCDVAIAVETAKIADPHVPIGLIAGDGGAIMWPQLIGYARAKHYLLTGDRITGKAAAEMGLIHQAVPADELDAAVDAYADKLAALPAQSLRWTKATMNIPLKQLAHSMMDVGMAYEGLASNTEDHLEGIHAIRERRKPVFKGK